MLRRLRIVLDGLTLLSLLGFVVFALLAVRSYRHIDAVSFRDQHALTWIASCTGEIVVWVESGWGSSFDYETQPQRYRADTLLHPHTIHRVVGFAFVSATGPPPVRIVVFPTWLLVAFAIPLPLVRFLRALGRRRRSRDGHCPTCGYDLRATPKRCPECGRAAA